MYTRILFILLTILAFTSCEYDKVGSNDPEFSPKQKTVCSDTAYTSYALSVKPIINGYCYSCHSTQATQGGGGLDLENYSTFKDYLTLDFRGDQIYGSLFYNCILKTQGAKAMPPTGKLTDCEIKKIKSWIDRGAPND